MTPFYGWDSTASRLEHKKQKTDIEGGLPKKGGAWTFCRFKGGEGVWQERRVVDTPVHTMTMPRLT